jgi:Protein of unknown function (DUF3316)
MKIRLLVILFFIAATIVGQTNDSIQKLYALKKSYSLYGISEITLVDPYLSPLPYTGYTINAIFGNERFLNPNHQAVSIANNQSYYLGATLNPSQTAYELYYAANCNWGFYYHYRVFENFKIEIGGLWDYQFGMKSNDRNVNNPYNVDLATNINLSLLALCEIPTPKRVIKIRFGFETPLLGCMFVPMPDETYYEVLYYGNFDNTIHFTHPFNKQGYKINVMADIPLKYTTWRLALTNQQVTYAANGMVFQTRIMGLSLGTTFDFASFAGRINTPPTQFINVDN